ncbi:GntR family transcriptional regulator [Petroclostridium sp. X23]|uniref:GntR family transcriptional regulator n=1 Tax=Petroclostridium sp. X23 TaxID=3045146 RepID=UPI0024ADADC3|nr:GntR family transcriptional regulator [Petroclostridium sp. X23]WHH59360.1 GntR family transcriptional regulator [Petroclostridium sp. X23]
MHLKNFDDKAPIYLQIMNDIKRDIIAGDLKGGSKLPSVREMAENKRVNPNTIQRAYQELERENVTFTQRGMGTFITENTEILSNLKSEMCKEVITDFINNLKSFGFSNNEIIDIIKNYLEKENL